MRNRKSIMEMFFHDICYKKEKHKTIYKENFFLLFRQSFVHGGSQDEN